MKVIFWSSDKPREYVFAREFIRGVKLCGDEGEIRHRGKVETGGYDIAVVSGVKSLEMWNKLSAAKVPTVFVDQGYFKERKYNRVAVNAHHPTWYLERAKHTTERWDSFRISVRPWRETGRHIVIAGGSEKYHRFYGLPHPTRYYRDLVERLKPAGRQIIYRPKPSWAGASPIDGTIYSTRRSQNYPHLFDCLRGAQALVTHGSNACYEAMIYGVPSIVLGNGIAKPISSTSLDDIDNPMVAADDERRQLLANLAWCQFSWSEFATGFAWKHLRAVINEGGVLRL